MKTTGNTILITGGGSGIGRALAHRWHDQGNKVIIAGRRRAALDEAVGDRANMVAVELDIEDAADIGHVAARIVADHPDLNVVVNNAGIMRSEALDAPRDLTVAVATILTNLLGPIRLIDALVDHLAGRPDSAIVTVSSGLAFVPLVFAPTYSATKAAIHSYSLSLREQLRGKVEVIELVPPGVQTGLTPGQESREGYMPLDDYIDEVMTLFAQVPTPQEIAVERVKFLRDAEAEGRFDATLATLTERSRAL